MWAESGTESILGAREGLQGILEARTVALTAASLPVRTTAEADAQVRVIDDWRSKNRTASPDLLVVAKGALRRFPGNAAGRESVCCSVGWGDHECKTQERRKKKRQTNLGQERCVGVGKASETSAR